MITEIKNYIADYWPNNSILVGGVEGIGREQYESLISNSNNPQEARDNLFGTSNYVNTGIIYVKEDDDDSIKTYFQPKIKASEAEQTIGMLEGRHIFLFKSSNYSFLCLICFDFIGRNRNSSISVTQDIIQKKQLKNSKRSL